MGSAQTTYWYAAEFFSKAKAHLSICKQIGEGEMDIFFEFQMGCAF